MNHRLIHDHAFQAAQEVFRTVKDCLMEHEQKDAFQEFYDILKSHLERYEAERARMLQRLRPLNN